MPAQLLLIRHGEKPDEGDELSPRGWQRAEALPKLFHRAPFDGFGKPVALYGASPAKADGSIRSIQTLKYVAQEFNLHIHDEFHRGDDGDLVKAIRENHNYDGKFVVICWEHKDLSKIARELGVSPEPKYPDDKFDRAWLVTMDGDHVSKFEDLPENLLPGDDAH